MRNFLTLMMPTNSQNDRVWAVGHADADKKVALSREENFRGKKMIWLGACSKSITPLMILDEGTVDHTVYIKKCFPLH